MEKRQKDRGRKKEGRKEESEKRGTWTVKAKFTASAVCKNSDVAGHHSGTCCHTPDRFKQENREVETGLECLGRLSSTTKQRPMKKSIRGW